MSKPDESWPVPLRTEPGEAGTALREYEQTPTAAPNEAAAYQRAMARLELPSTRWRYLLAMGTAATALGTLLCVLRPGTPAFTNSPLRPGHQSGAMAKAAPPLPATPRTEPVVQLGMVPTTLPTGKLTLAGGITGELAAGASASARQQSGTLDIALASGRIELRVPPREVGQALLIAADQFLFTVVGTRFSLAKQSRRIDLEVSEGLVAVSSGGEHVATVASGENWSVDLPPADSRWQESAPRVARHTPRQDCARFAPRQQQERLACYREQARKGGPEAEHAQHALGRYLRDYEVDLTGALAAFEAQRARFPHGELKTDADRAIIDLLPRLGRHAEALVETQSFLDAQPEAEDRAEIRLLRGDIYRAIFQDVMSAEREYEEGTGADGRTGDDSRFLHALCLEALGRVDEARLAYRDYLAQPGTAHAREAQRRMERLVH